LPNNQKYYLPTNLLNNLDSENAAKMMATLKNWQEQTNGTVIMITHHLEHAFSYSDQIIVLMQLKPIPTMHSQLWHRLH